MRLNNNPVCDNITDVLTKIYDFTLQRHRVLMANIANASNPGYVPLDLPVEEFAAVMEIAVLEHTRANRLLFCDTSNVKFGSNSIFSAQPLADNASYALLKKNKNEFLELQLQKLAENTINQKITRELLKQKQGLANSLSAMQM